MIKFLRLMLFITKEMQNGVSKLLEKINLRQEVATGS
jgi:hypothetical protein